MTNPMDEWQAIVPPMELAQVVNYSNPPDWHNDPMHNSEPEATPGFWHRVARRVMDAIVYFGEPFRPYRYTMPSGVLFGPDGRTYSDQTVTAEQWHVERMTRECQQPEPVAHPCYGSWCQHPLHVERY